MMKMPFDLFQKKSHEEEETYLGLFLKENEGMLFYISPASESKLKITKREKFVFTDGWNRLIEDVDEVLNRLETTTGKSPEKTVFFIYSHLVDPTTKEIKRPYLQRIKQLAKNLELKPLGFIECHEAILDYLQQKEKLPLTANLIEFDKSELGIFVYTTGRLIFSEIVPRTDNVIADLMPVFERIRMQTVIPPRIILYNSKDLDLESASIITHQWGKDFFIQLPKVQIFKEEEVIASFLDIFSSQLAGAGPDANIPVDGHKPNFQSKKEVMGFVIGDDVKDKPDHQAPDYENAAPLQTKLRQPSSVKNLIPLEPLMKFIANGRKIVTNLVKKAKALPFPVLPIIGGVLIVGALLSMEYFFHSAKVRVFFPSQNLKKNLEINAVAGASTVKKDVLALREGTETADFSESSTATGRRSVGDKAKGTVAMLNYDSNSKTFDKGTIIQAEGLKFALTNDVTVASSSVAPDLSLQPGKNNVPVLAEQIGSESNLAKGKKFQVADFPQTQYLATNEDAFSGGTKKDVQTVSEEDITSIESKILAKAKKYTDNQLKAKLPKEERLISKLTEVDPGDITYSQDAGDEAASVEGKSRAKITYFAYKQKDFLQIINQNLEGDVKPGFNINDSQTKYTITSVDQDESNYLLGTSVQVKATEDIKTADLLSRVRGKRTSTLPELVKKDYRADGIEIEVGHPIPWLKNWMPLFKKNIILEISYL